MANDWHQLGVNVVRKHDLSNCDRFKQVRLQKNIFSGYGATESPLWDSM